MMACADLLRAARRLQVRAQTLHPLHPPMFPSARLWAVVILGPMQITQGQHRAALPDPGVKGSWYRLLAGSQLQRVAANTL